MPILKISGQSFDEFKMALEKAGRAPNDKGQIVLEKDDKLEPPFDVRTQIMRKDCLEQAVKMNGNDVLDMADKFYKFVLNGETNNKPLLGKGWK